MHILHSSLSQEKSWDLKLNEFLFPFSALDWREGLHVSAVNCLKLLSWVRRKCECHFCPFTEAWHLEARLSHFCKASQQRLVGNFELSRIQWPGVAICSTRSYIFFFLVLNGGVLHVFNSLLIGQNFWILTIDTEYISTIEITNRAECFCFQQKW